MSKYQIVSNKWYGRFWPPERKKVRLMQVIVDHTEPELQKQFDELWRDIFIRGKLVMPPNSKYKEEIDDQAT